MEEESTATEEGGLGAVGMDVDEGAGSGAEDGVVTDGVSAASEGGEQGQPETQAQAQTQTQTEAETETETETETQTQVSEQDHEDVAKAEKSGNEADMLVEKKVEDETSDEAAAVEGKEEGTLEEKTEEAEEGKAIGEGEEDAGAEAVAGGAVGKKRAREEDEEAGSGEGADASNPSSGILSSSSSPDPALKRPKVESSPTGEVHKVRGGVIATPLQAQEIGQRLPPGQALVPAVEVSASKQFTPAYGKRQHKPKTPVFPGNAEDGLSGRRRSHVTSEDMQKSGQFGSVPVNVWRKKARELLVTLNSKDFAILFSVPVDPVVLGIPTYFNVIKNPMDLGTVKSKLSTNLARTKYRTFDSFLNDVRQTFQNAITFNGPQHEVGALATEFLSLVEKEIADFDKIHNTAFSKLTPPLPVTPSTPMAVDDAIVEVPAEVPDAGVVRKSNRRSSGPSSRQSTASSSIGNVIQELETARSQVETDLGKLLEFKRAVSTKLCDSMRLDFHEGELRKALNIITEDLIGARSGSMPPDRGQLLSPSTPTSAASGGSSARRGSRPPGSASSATSGGSATTSRSQPSSRPASTSSHGGPGGPAHRKSNKTSKGSSTPASSSSNTSGNSGAKRTGSSSTPSSRPKSSSSSHHRGDVKEMDPIEKRRLSYNIDKLPSEHLSEVLNIITQNSKINVDEDDDEVVVDIDKLDKFTLRKLDEYVQQCMSQRRKSQGTTRKPPPKKPAPSSTAARAGNSAGSANTGLSASGGDSEYGLLPPIPENEGKAGSSGAAVSKSSTSTTAATSTSGASASGTPASSQPAAATSSTGGTPASQASASGATKTGTPASASAPPPKPSSTWNGEIESTSSESSSGEDESSDSESDPQDGLRKGGSGGPATSLGEKSRMTSSGSALNVDLDDELDLGVTSLRGFSSENRTASSVSLASPSTGSPIKGGSSASAAVDFSPVDTGVSVDWALDDIGGMETPELSRSQSPTSLATASSSTYRQFLDIASEKQQRKEDQLAQEERMRQERLEADRKRKEEAERRVREQQLKEQQEREEQERREEESRRLKEEERERQRRLREQASKSVTTSDLALSVDGENPDALMTELLKDM